MTTSTLLSAINSKQWPTALSAALPLWRKARGPRLGSLIETLSKKCETKKRAWPKTRSEFCTLWHELAEEPEEEDVAALLETLDTFGFLPSSEPGPRTGELVARLETIKKWPADPRVASRLRALLDEETRRARDGILTEDLLRPALKLVAGQRDARTVPWLERYISHNPSKSSILRNMLVRQAEQLQKAHPDAADPTWIGEVEAAVHGVLGKPKQKSKSIDQLISAALEAPNDLGQRAVLADALLEDGDPRGEFLSLDLAALERALTSEEEKRRDQLQKKHRVALLGELAPIARAARFRGGFATELTLVASFKASERAWKDAIASRWMSTVTHVDGSDAYLDTFLQVLHSPFAQSLRGVNITVAGLEALLSTPVAKQLEWLRVVGPPRKNSAPLLKRLPALRRLEVTCRADSSEAIDWALATPQAVELVAQVPVVSNRSDEEARRLTIVEPAVRLLKQTKLAHVQLNEWSLRRESKGVKLAWIGPPLWSGYEAWTLVAFRKHSALKLIAEEVQFKEPLVGATPKLRKALTA